jgi:hypothetical protein
MPPRPAPRLHDTRRGAPNPRIHTQANEDTQSRPSHAFESAAISRVLHAANRKRWLTLSKTKW